MPETDIIIYATNWCPDCRRARRFFDEHQITYQWINIDHDRTAEKVVLNINHGMRSVPTILFPDGSTLVEPSIAELKTKFQISVE